MMKKFSVLLSGLLSAILLLTSCGTQTTVRDAFFDTYLLTSMVSAGHTTPAKFNASTGTLTPLCEDPLCMHDTVSGCPFAQILGEVTFEDGCLYFRKQLLPSETGDGYDTAVMCYDMETASVREVLRISEMEKLCLENGFDVSGYSSGIRLGHFWYGLYNDAGTELEILIRTELKTGKHEVFTDDFFCPASEYTDGRYFASVESGPMAAYSPGFVIADFDGGNPEYHLTDEQIAITFWDQMDGDTMLYATIGKNEDGSWDWEHMTLRSYNIETGDRAVVLEEFPDVYFAQIGDWMYYTPYLDEPISLGVEKHSGQEKFSKTGGVLVRVNLSTGVAETVFEMPEYNLSGTDIHAVGQYVVIGYANVDYEDYTTETTMSGETVYNYAREDGRIVYDTTTGGTKIYAEG